MRWFGLPWMLAGLAACTSDNPEFDGEAGPVQMRDTDEADSGGSATSPSSGLVTTDSAGSTSSSGTASTGDDGLGSSGGVDESDGSSGEPPPDACAFDKSPFFIEVANANGEVLDPGCEPLDLLGQVAVLPDGSGLEITVCQGACVCDEPFELLAVSFGEEGVVSDVYGGCRRVRVWSSPAAASTDCDEWTGFSIEPTDGAPYVIGSNRLAIDLPSLATPVELGEGKECGERSCEDGMGHPGHYALAVGDVEVWPDDEPTTVLFTGVEYTFDTRTANITESCALQVSWRAELR